jgi:PAS domain S-box-containing protein
MQSKPRRSAENNFITLLNFIADPAIIFDGKGRFLVVNDAFMDLTGLSKKELLSTAFLDLNVLTAENKAILFKNLEKRMRGVSVEPYEISFTNRTGETRCVEVKAKKIDYAGQPADLVTFRDITRRKENARQLEEYSEKMEALVNDKVKEVKESAQKLKESEEKYRTQFEEALDAIFVADPKTGILIDCNRAALELVSREKTELIGEHQRILHPPEQIEGEFSRTFKQHLKEKEGQILESQVITKRGEIKDVAIKASAFEVRGKKLLQGIFRDITEQKRAEAALKESEEKYRELINGMNDTAWVIGLDANFIDVNDAAVKVLGYSREELLSMGPPDIDNSLTKEQILDLIRSMPADQTQVFETAHTTKNGKKIPVEISSSLVTYQGKQAILSIARNITERKQLEDALRKSEEMFRAISTSAMDSIILIDENDEVVYWNPAAEKIFGYTKKEAMGNDLAKLVIPPQGHKPHLKLLKKLTQGSSPAVHLELTALRKNGAEFPMELSATSVKLKDRNYMLGIVRDVFERRRMEDELKQERGMLEAVTENIGAGLTVISKNYRILWANKFLKQAFGDVKQKPCYSTYHKRDTICPDCGVKKVFEGNATFDAHEFAFTDYKGNTQWIELIVTPIKDRDGTVIAALELVVNITERKIMQDKLSEYSQKLEKLVEKRTKQLKQTQAKLVKSERLATIGELAAMVGHDMRNPLTGIMGAAYYLKTKHSPELGAKGKEMLETIENAINYSNKIVNDLLEYSRDLNLDLAEVTPKALLKNALSSLEVPDKIQIVDAIEYNFTVKADKAKMLRVFVNIIKNAIDAMPEGGTLTISSREVKGKLEIVFKDTGTGMSEETLSKLKRGVPLFTTKAKGMGFGLPICRRIVEAHGGKISVESKIGKGTKVTVTIPVKPKPLHEDEENWIFSESMLSAITAIQGKT